MWYVMQVYTGQEMEVCEKCRARVMLEGEDVFVPLAERQIKIRGQRTITKARLFPGYVFFETQQPDDFHQRLKRVGAMTKILRTGDDITPLYPEEEAYLKRLCGENHIAEYSEGYLEGEKLVVTSGALKDYEGTVKKVLRHKRLVVLEVPLLGRTVEVTLGLGVVEKRLG